MSEGATQKHLQMVPWASAPAPVVFSAYPIGLKQIQQSVRVMLVLISGIKLRLNSKCNLRHLLHEAKWKRTSVPVSHSVY